MKRDSGAGFANHRSRSVVSGAAHERVSRLLGRPEYASDFWVIQFDKILPPGVAAETPGCVLIEVIDATQVVREAY